MEPKYGPFKIKMLREYVRDWLSFKECDYESYNELLFAIKEVKNRKKELRM